MILSQHFEQELLRRPARRIHGVAPTSGWYQSRPSNDAVALRSRKLRAPLSSGGHLVQTTLKVPPLFVPPGRSVSGG